MTTLLSLCQTTSTLDLRSEVECREFDLLSATSRQNVQVTAEDDEERENILRQPILLGVDKVELRDKRERGESYIGWEIRV